MGFIVVAAVIVAYIAFACIWQCRKDNAFLERFPPISEDEFVAQCGPGTNREIAIKVRRIFADQLGIEYERIHATASIINDLGAD